MSPSVRIATIGDLDALMGLEKEFPGDRMSRRSARHLLRSASAVVLVAELSGLVVGSLVLLLRRGARAGRIYSLVTASTARRSGVAMALLHAAEAHCRAVQRSAMSLEVRADNQAARAFYQGAGYRMRKTLPAYYEDGGDGLQLQKLLIAS